MQKTPKPSILTDRPVSASRARDFHNANKLTENNKKKVNTGGIKVITIDLRPAKTQTPMHRKLYESTLQDVYF